MTVIKWCDYISISLSHKNTFYLMIHTEELCRIALSDHFKEMSCYYTQTATQIVLYTAEAF